MLEHPGDVLIGIEIERCAAPAGYMHGIIAVQMALSG
jgi:hypothetical protein